MSHSDIARGIDGASVGAALGFADHVKWRPVLTVEKFDADQVAFVTRKTGVLAPSGSLLSSLVDPYEVVVSPGNLLTTAGLTRITSLITGGGGQAATNTSARIGVGNSSTAEAVGQTDLQAAAGSANRWFQIMDATYPQTSAGVMTFKATFGTADGNYAWNEWCIDIGTPTVTSANTVNATMLNRKVQSLGTKTSVGTWAATATITIA